MRILIVDDEIRLAESLARGLREEGFHVTISHDGEDGLHRALTEPFDLAILDVMLPKRDGWQVLARLRTGERGVRVLMLTARHTVEERVRGLEAGADDYLTKPFAFSELLARVRALLRRPAQVDSGRLVLADLEIEPRRHRVTRGGRTVTLTPREFAVLSFLAQHAGEVISRTRLAEEVWDENFDRFSNVIDVTLSHLRAKVDREFERPLIHTIRGAGYVFQATPPGDT